MSLVVTPLHAHFSPSRLVNVIEAMRTLGPPTIRGYFDEVSGAWFASEGTHRLRAAMFLGLVPVMVSVPWRRGAEALRRARFAIQRRGHVFP